MIGAISLVVVLLALALMATWVLAWPLLGAWRLVTRRMGHRFSLAALLLPPLGGFALALGAVWPSHSNELAANCHCDPVTSVVHLCLAHPDGATPLLPLAIFTLVWFGWRPVRSLIITVKRLRAARSLLSDRSWSTDPTTGVLLGELDDDNAYTVGLLRPRVIVDRAWWLTLDEVERSIVAAHEQAHVRCADPLNHTVALTLAGFAPARLAGPLATGWLGWTELRADQNAAQASGDPVRVAAFLVAQRRRDLALALVPAFGGGDLERRVTRLLDTPLHQPRLRSDLPLTAGLGGGGLVLVLTLLGYQIHGLVERAFHLLN